jgi:tyrosyl-tRNA synthetase
MPEFPPVDQQMRVLMRGIDFGDPQTFAVMERELRARLQESFASGQPLRVYCGYDPSSPDLHLGHTLTMRKLRQFQDLGHDVTFLIGTFTGMVGDASDKESARKQQSLDESLGKAETYAEQVFRILDRERTTVRYNHEWLAKLTFADVVHLASHFTVQQFLARDNFAKRHEKGDAIGLQEFFYALMQGYDAVALQTDVQVGGTEQLFNLMAGRKLMEAFGQRPQIVLTVPILVGTDGVLRMSKSTGNSIGINEPPGVIFTKVLNVPDAVMRNYAELATRWDQESIDADFAAIERGALSMREFKHKLAREIVSIFHGEETAGQAAEDARRMHTGQAPSDAPSITLLAAQPIVDVLLEAGLVQSKGEARRLIEQGGVRLDGESVGAVDATVGPNGAAERVVQAGKRKYLRVHFAGVGF